MINTETIYNLIAQDLVKEYDNLGDNEVPSLMAVNGSKLHFYKQHQVIIETYGHNSS